jgi:hypothetical protein
LDYSKQLFLLIEEWNDGIMGLKKIFQVSIIKNRTLKPHSVDGDERCVCRRQQKASQMLKQGQGLSNSIYDFGISVLGLGI